MLLVDLLFFDGKLVPLHLPSLGAPSQKPVTEAPEIKFSGEIARFGGEKASEAATTTANGGVDSAYLFSPKTPRCSSRWRELLGLKKSIEANHNSTSSTSSASALGSEKSIRRFFHRSSKSASFSSSLTLPLLKDSSDSSESVSVSSRLSLSSSSSGHDVDDLRRLSLDTDKNLHLNRSSSVPNPPKVRLVKSRPPVMDHSGSGVGRGPAVRRGSQDPKAIGPLVVAADSPRMNSSGKIVFKGLERSSSSPSSLNGVGGGGGGMRYKYGGMERSYSANVRVTPVLNVPVCSLRGSSKSGVFGFGQLFGQSSSANSVSKKEVAGAGNGKFSHQHQQHQSEQQQQGAIGKCRKEST
ncbi:hypothetical protein Droror1_Dr00004593 [Drosera rotundifolia]